VSLIVVLKVANMAAFTAFGRPLDPAVDSALIPAGWDLLVRSRGWPMAIASLAGGMIGLGILSLILGKAWRTLADFTVPRPAAVGLLAISAALSVVPLPGVSRDAARLVVQEAQITMTGAKENAAFKAALADDPLSRIPSDKLLSALKGHDVLLVFVESYGRVMVDDPRFRADSHAQLDHITRHLTMAGFGSRSAWLTSPTFGGQSWLAHGTMVSGLWINDQRRYDSLVHSRRPTMIADFRRAGWRTVAVMPEITMGWPEARFFGHDAVYDGPTLDFAGQPFAYVTMADQFTLSKFQRLELQETRRLPVMAEIALVTSHAPWTPLPKLVPWEDVGDGRIFDAEREGATPDEVWDNPEEVPKQYARSISYVLATLESFVLTYGNDNTVMIILGDHQPMSFVSGEDAPRDVPVHIIARDPAVLAAFDTWGWKDGMRPDETSPVWTMDAIRGRLLITFSGAP
jgi:hypothetical protein